MDRKSIERIFTFGYMPHFPERNILVGYAIYLIIGTALLALPPAHRHDIAFVDNLFTAASALSTTGLSTVDIGSAYSLAGQIVILLLVQIGGIGYMTVCSYIINRTTRHPSLPTSRMLGATVGVPAGMSLRGLVNNIVHFTLIFEAAGFVALYAALRAADTPAAAWHALFLSVSSFCTAGFSLFSDSLCAFADNPGVTVPVAVLSYAGAMGFIFMTDITDKLRRPHYRVSFTSKVILLVTAVLTVGGTALLAHDMDGGLMPAFFQTMSAMTTVGFNTVGLGGLAAGPLLVLCVIMFVGASPSGTGGGVKSTSVSAVWGYVVSRLGVRRRVTFLGREIPAARVETALTTVIAYGLVLLAACVVLTYSEPYSLSESLFEATSAIGTVGLSTGITAELSVTGKIVIITLMYIGRVGVLTLGTALMARNRATRATVSPADLAL